MLILTVRDGIFTIKFSLKVDMYLFQKGCKDSGCRNWCEKKKLRYKMKVDSVQEFCKRQVYPIQSFQKEKQDAHAYD